jgi:hypothetical protein
MSDPGQSNYGSWHRKARKAVRIFGGLGAYALLALLVLACGGGHKEGTSSTADGQSSVADTATTTSVPPSEAPESGRLRGDEDDDDGEEDVRRRSETEKADGDVDFDANHDAEEHAAAGYYDSDDGPVRNFGRRATPRQRLALIMLVDDYYAVATAANGAAACSLMFSLLEESIPEQWAQAPGPKYLRGLKTCPEVLTHLFKHIHSLLALPFRVTEVRVKGKLAQVLLASPALPARLMEARSEAGVWKIDRVTAGGLP